MPWYDIRCENGHAQELRASRDEVLACPICGAPAQRVIIPGHAPSVSGFAPTPTRERYVNVDRAINAQHELIQQAERQHVELPDFWKIAKARIARGDVKEIV